MSVTNRESHKGFRVMPTSVTLNGLERVKIAFICVFFLPKSIVLHAICVTMIENRPIIMSAKYCLPLRFSLLAKTNPLCSAVSLR